MNPAQFENYDLPALFVDWTIKWEKSGKTYNGSVALDFHLVTDATWDTSNISTNHVEGLKNELYHVLTRSILDDLEGEDTSKLKRADENPIDTGVVNYHVLRYTCEYYDPMLSGPEYIEATIEAIKVAKQLVKVNLSDQ
ncbi:hypothetical protein D3C78_1132450 [compost metagenome]